MDKNPLKSLFVMFLRPHFMRYIIVTFCLLFSFTVVAQKPLPITEENLTLLALSKSTPEKIDEYVLYLAKENYIFEYVNVKKDPIKKKAFLDKIKKELTDKIKNIKRSSTFLFTKELSYYNYNEEKQLMKLATDKISTIKLIPRKNTSKDIFHSYFHLLFANLNILSKINVDNATYEKLERLRTNVQGRLKTKLFVELSLELKKFQNNRDFQTIIKQAKIYDSKKKILLLATVNETKDSDEKIQKWLLSDGLTNQLMGIHAFTFLGYRLQDYMPSSLLMQKNCKKTKKIGIHQQLVCTYPYTDNTQLIMTHLGGIVSQMELVATRELTNYEKKTIAKTIMQQLKKDREIFKTPLNKWTKYGVDFIFYSDAFFGKTSKVSKYVNPYRNEKESDKTLIISMVPKTIKKIIEENK